MLVSREDEEIMREITEEINRHSRFEINITAKDSMIEIAEIDALLFDDYDITTVDNTLDYRASKRKLRTIIPFLHEVLVVISKHQLNGQQIDSLLRIGNYLVISKEFDELEFFREMIPHFTGEKEIKYQLERHFDLENDLANNDLLLFFTTLENKELGKFLFEKKAYIYSLDNEESKGSFIEGFCHEYKKTTPYLVTRYAFGTALEKPIYTLAVHELLMTTTNLPSQVVYDLIETIHHHHLVPIFESSNSNSFQVNHQDINLSFPFHQGTVDYLNRDQPSFIERYSEFMGFVLSAFIVLFGLGASIRANINQRKKDRMDEYYDRLLKLKSEVHSLPIVELRDRLTKLQEIVFDLLIREKLSANNEFTIFMMLWDEIHHEMLRREDHNELGQL